MIGALKHRGADPLLAKMARLPAGYTHVGIASTDVGVTAVIASDSHTPLVWHPTLKSWVELATKTEGGVLLS